MTENSSYELLITGEESRVLEAIAQSVIPHSQRAQALLAVDAGSTVDQAAVVAGLKNTQVRYWIGRFRNARLHIFPEELLIDIEALLKEREEQDKGVEKKAGKTGTDKNKKETSDPGKKNKKKQKNAKKKKAGKSKLQKKTKSKKAEKSKGKKNKKKKTGKKK